MCQEKERQVIAVAEKEEGELWPCAGYVKYCLLLLGGSCKAALAASGSRDRDGQPDFLQAPWGPSGVQNVFCHLVNTTRVLGKAAGAPASSYKGLSQEIVFDGARREVAALQNVNTSVPLECLQKHSEAL